MIVLLRLGKQDIDPEQADLLAIKQLIHQQGHFLAAPGPAPDLLQAVLVHIDDHDAAVQFRYFLLLQQGPVINVLLQPRDRHVAEHAGRVRQQQQHG